MQTVHLDTTKLKQATNSSKTAVAAMITLGMRQRARSQTTLSQLKSQLLEMGEKVVDRDYMDFWRGLEQAGAGSIILGRRGKQTRFEWNYSLIKLAKMAIEGKEEEIQRLSIKKNKPLVTVEPSAEFKPAQPFNPIKFPRKEMAKLPEKTKTKEETPHITSVMKQEKLVYSILVRPGYIVEINLPADLSQKELERIKTSLVLPKL